MSKLKLMGDPHLGRKFRTGVPLDRIGEREAMVWAQFKKELQIGANVTQHVMMGDLFDKFVVAPEIVLRAANIYGMAADAQPQCIFYVLRGNHDVSRDTLKASSFDIFSQLVARHPNILVINEVIEEGGVAYIPYDPFTTAHDQVLGLSDNLETVFMHHDYVDWGGDYVIPTQLLADKGILKVITGHDHTRREEKRHGVTVEITGSMQPYTHGEDPTGSMYWTGPLEDLPADVKMMNIRILLSEGETLPADLDCLSLTAKRITDEDDKVTVDTSEFESLEIPVMLSSVLDGLSCRDAIMAKFEEDRE
jgi:DNA repair exonuclease SbcCD nuclease subunit